MIWIGTTAELIFRLIIKIDEWNQVYSIYNYVHSDDTKMKIT